jgi:vacuolar-type H+-ATPase subunit H
VARVKDADLPGEPEHLGGGGQPHPEDAEGTVEAEGARAVPSRRSRRGEVLEQRLSALLSDAIELVRTGRSVPLSEKVMVPRDVMLEILSEALESVPEEVRSAKYVLAERDELLAQAEAEARRILEEAKARAAQMVARTEIVRNARHEAQRIVEDALEKARKLEREVDEYCDRKLASFEAALERVRMSVAHAREKLLPRVSADREEKAPRSRGSFFNQEEA